MKSKQVSLAMLSLSYLVFFSCSNKKPDADDKYTLSAATNVESKILKPCHWTYRVEQSSRGEATLISTAKLDSGWHLYSQYMSGKGPETKFAYHRLPTYQLLGPTEEGKSTKEYNPYLETEVLYFEKEAVFTQKIKVLSKEDFTVNGTIDYMVCLTQCVLSDEEFSFKVKGNAKGE